MPILDISRPEQYEDVGITVYRAALNEDLCRSISRSVFALFGNALSEVRSKVRGVRHFRTSSVMPLSVMPELEDAVTSLFKERFGTMKVNIQGPNGKQGWHRDYIDEPVVLYPIGEGFIDVNPNAVNLEEARSRVEDDGIVTIPIARGDVAMLERGGELFHRGRNASDELPRPTLVLH